jgi:hypothetical protein
MVNYLYHMVPENMKGTTLYPLNELRMRQPEVYREAIKKYKGREGVLKIRIPTLDCLWNDVLHMTAVHPEKIRDYFKLTGVVQRKTKWFKLDPYDLDPEKGTIYLYNEWRMGGKNNFSAKNFVPFAPLDLRKYNFFPQKTLDYLMEEVEAGRQPFMFHHVPHVLYKGSISVKGVKVIES